MKIYGESRHELCHLQLRLKSLDMNFGCKFNQPVYPNSGVVEPDRDGCALIEFRDSHEIDQLIDILQRFKKENRQYMGEW